MFKKFLLAFLLCSHSLFGAKLPELTPHDVVATLNQIMANHVTHKNLTPPLVKRALQQYIDELDPTKTYFLMNEVTDWILPPELELPKICKAIEHADFSTFTMIHQRMAGAIKRRNRIELELETSPLPTDVSIEEFKDQEWAKNEEELTSRLLRLKALQADAADKLDPDSRNKVLQRIAKRRTIREEELLSTNREENEKLILSNVLKAFAPSFDTHTAYFTPGEATQFMIQVQQRLFGIGAQLRDDLNGFTIVKIIEGGPASRSNLKANDRVIAINGEPVVGLEITDTVELIRGEEGTPVNLTVLRQAAEKEERHEIEILRGEVVIKEARIDSSVIPYGDGVIARIALHAFYQDPNHSSSADIYEELMKIRRDHQIKGVILDLRHNSGGVLPQAVAVTGLFITKGIVVSIKDNQGTIEHLREIDGKTAYDGPLIVLTSKASASAAEIVAQTLQDYGRAIVVGDEHTYGKGTFQTFTLDASNNGNVNPKGEFKVTRGRYYTVSGKSPQYVGVTPDIVIPGFYSAMEIGERYAKFPLENDSIQENFLDDLSDIPPVQRDQISWLYRFNLQTKLKTYVKYISLLKRNSEARIADNKLFQSFLTDLKKEDVEERRFELYGQSDPQLYETVNIMKDLILLLN